MLLLLLLLIMSHTRTRQTNRILRYCWKTRRRQFYLVGTSGRKRLSNDADDASRFRVGYALRRTAAYLLRVWRTLQETFDVFRLKLYRYYARDRIVYIVLYYIRENYKFSDRMSFIENHADVRFGTYARTHNAR